MDHAVRRVAALLVARSIWNGTITFGVLAVPVKVHSATQSKSVRFHQVHAPDGARIEHKRIDPATGDEVPYGDIDKGFEVSEGTYIVLEKAEVDAAAGERSRLIEVEEFVQADAIDPVFYDRTYYLGARDAEDAYRLLRAALERTGRAGIARWVFHNREYLVAIRSLGDVLALHTMRFHDELVDPSGLEIPTPSRKPSDKEIEMAGALVETLHAPFSPEDDLVDTHREQLLEYLDQKRKGKAPKPKKAKPPAPSDDLLAALEASMKAVKG
jgi:DNA end-binding protein Ku